MTKTAHDAAKRYIAAAAEKNFVGRQLNSAEALNEFVSTTLQPIFLKLGLTPPQPSVYPVHNYMGTKVEEFISA